MPSAAWTTWTGSGSPPASRSPNGTPSAVASAESVSIVGLPLPASSAESVAFAIPLARASSDRLRPCSPRRRRRLAATTGMRSFIMPNERTNESNGNTHRVRDGARVIAPFAVAVGAFGLTFGVLARDAGLGGVEGDRLLGDDLRRLGPVRRDVGPLRRRDAGGRHRRRGAAQHALRADRAVGGAVAARAGVEAWPARAARRRRVVGREPPRRRALRRRGCCSAPA